MKPTDVLRRLPRAAAAACLGVVATAGCHPSPPPRPATRPMAAATTRPALVPAVPLATAQPTPPAAMPPAPPAAVVEWADARVQRIDGRPGAFATKAWGGVSLPPGPHTLHVHLVADWAPFNEATSAPDVEVTFTAEAGHHYRLAGWPAAVRDTTDGHADGREYAVRQSTRYTTWEE